MCKNSHKICKTFQTAIKSTQPWQLGGAGLKPAEAFFYVFGYTVGYIALLIQVTNRVKIRVRA